jgi:tetratricopeptide (TPR) repeat protein
MDLDPDPARMRMREAIAQHDRAVMLDLTSPSKLGKLQPGSISILCAELWGEGQRERQPDVFRILDQALQLYPGDFVLQAFAGSFYQTGLRFESALSCRSAALSLRPGDLVTHADVAESLASLGRLTEAESHLATCLAADPEHAGALFLLGQVQLQLGDYAAGLASLSRVSGVDVDTYSRPTFHMAQYYAGLMTREALEAEVPTVTQDVNLGVYFWALVEHPDPAQRDPEFVLRARASETGAARSSRSIAATSARSSRCSPRWRSTSCTR